MVFAITGQIFELCVLLCVLFTGWVLLRLPAFDRVIGLASPEWLVTLGAAFLFIEPELFGREARRN
jgi:hypothetical protein